MIKWPQCLSPYHAPLWDMSIPELNARKQTVLQAPIFDRKLYDAITFVLDHKTWPHLTEDAMPDPHCDSCDNGLQDNWAYCPYCGRFAGPNEEVKHIAKLEAGEWRPIESAPLDAKSILLFTTCHGQVEARFCPGKWHEYLEGSEYDGPVWVCADDAFQIEIEETPEGLLHGTATHWMPLPAPPGTSDGGTK